jgi:hypothetical protein
MLLVPEYPTPNSPRKNTSFTRARFQCRVTSLIETSHCFEIGPFVVNVSKKFSVSTGMTRNRHIPWGSKGFS